MREIRRRNNATLENGCLLVDATHGFQPFWPLSVFSSRTPKIPNQQKRSILIEHELKLKGFITVDRWYRKHAARAAKANKALNTNSGLDGGQAGGREVYVIHLNLSKTFDKLPRHLLVTKLQQYGVSSSVLQWFLSYLSNGYQFVVLDGEFSDWLPVTSRVLQCSILGPQNTTCLDTFRMGLALPCSQTAVS